MSPRVARPANQIAFTVFALVLFASPGRAAQKQDYSGEYLLQPSKSGGGSLPAQRLIVSQSDDAVEVTVIDGDRKISNRYSLNGLEGPYTSPGGEAGKCKGRITGGSLVLESVVMTKPQPFASPVAMHTKEQWRLSSDLKTLTVKSEVDFPGVREDAATVTGVYSSGTTKYARINAP